MSFTEKLTLRSPADVVTAVPYLLGFHPTDASIVVIVSRHGRVVFAARTDLPAPDAPAHQIRDLAGRLIPVLHQQQPITELLLVGYGTAEHVDPALHAVRDTFTAEGMTVQEILRVTGTRFVSLLCDNRACCPPEGTPFDPTASLVAVQATAAGLVAFPDRAAVAARFAPLTGAARDRMQQATDTAVARLEALLADDTAAVDEAGPQAVRAALRHPDRALTDDEAAWLTVLLVRLSVRDLAADLSPPTDQYVTFWTDITRRAHETLVPAPATLLAITAWRCGDGALAAMAAERALQVDPGYRLADLLLQALHAGLPPSMFEQTATPTDPDAGWSSCPRRT
ncbi:DUF4192 domain-containing protein [Micromonospora maris]|uniref:DUF4192 domain-containing protein n=1 Tax=Micromonospora maris TaxID=1003110 RepID=A0A9X0LBD3_9ACTN|nr:DUF4192 domain-containing protein [Micromonospora maris]AEB44311.1 hypothetical protein VAB18032_16005 [Micromonospora maris AB-18-032]KUJ43853.1 hypothetical protein ADL17_11335 [Micromonospora maris]